jgi:dTDP-4-amino-4,6-dideoxygalactose transaminase
MGVLKNKGIPTFIYYIKPLHLQKAYENFLTATQGTLPVCEELSDRVLSLPMHPYLSKDIQDYIIESIKNNLG